MAIVNGQKDERCGLTWMKLSADLLLLSDGHLLRLRYIQVLFPAVVHVKLQSFKV